MQYPAPALHRLDACRIARVGWRADYEGMVGARGAVALLAPAAQPLCDSLHACRCSTLRIDAEPGVGVDGLTEALVEALEWLRAAQHGLPLGVFGVGVGALAALQAAAWRPELIAAVVALDATEPLALLPLGRVCAATLLVVGREDPALLEAHRRALPMLCGARRLEIVPGAGDSIDAPAAQAVGHLAAQWFAQRLPLRPLH